MSRFETWKAKMPGFIFVLSETWIFAPVTLNTLLPRFGDASALPLANIQLDYLEIVPMALAHHSGWRIESCRVRYGKRCFFRFRIVRLIQE
jgi:hypothetical protein